jgi:glycosyltransferase involved in cell wall biosynthesis
MNIAYIGHGYHEKTKSSRFMTDFLQQHSRNLDLFADYSTIGGQGIDLVPIVEGSYDLIVVWQMERVAEWLVERVPERLVFVPMFDSACFLKRNFWTKFRNSRVLNFSWALHGLTQKLGIPSLRVQYFPDPSAFRRVDFFDSRGFLWQRRQEIAWPLIKQLSAGNKFARFALHLALDTGYGDPFVPDSEDLRTFNITLSHWCEDRSKIDMLLANSNMYFAPRSREGIGMSFLEAMARGQCVVAPDAPTMSEYMTHGVSGLLYDESDPQPLDLSNAAEIGAGARRKVERGFAHWQRDQCDLLPEFFFCGRKKAYALLRIVSHAGPSEHKDGRKSLASAPVPRMEGGRRLTGRVACDRPEAPLVTVAMVTRDAYQTFCLTLDSILSQTYQNLEVLVIDGGSRDGTLGLIQDKAAELDYWSSEPDQGAYDAMNKAARLARGRYILFMNAGDLFFSERAIAEAMNGISESNTPDFIFGHHVYVTKMGIEEYHRANDFADTWRVMREGTYSWKWLDCVPCHQATLTRTALLQENGYDLSLRFAADHEFIYRMRAKGASLRHCDTTLAIYFAGGISSQNEALCHEEWWRIACTYGDKQRADHFFKRGSWCYRVARMVAIWFNFAKRTGHFLALLIRP